MGPGRPRVDSDQQDQAPGDCGPLRRRDRRALRMSDTRRISAMTAVDSDVHTDVHTFAFWERSRDERTATFKWLRENDPVSWHPPAESLLLPPEQNVKGFWSITKYAHVQEVSRSPVFCSGQGIFMEDMPEVVLAAAMS